MRANEMTKVQMDAGVKRTNKADEILADFQQQWGFELPEPWRVCVRKLLLGGLGDPELHEIFTAYAQTEYQEGRMEERTVDYVEWAKEEQ